LVIYAEERSCTTQYELGELFYKGHQGSRDFNQAFKWYRKAAKKGLRQAQHQLGSMYARGQGVTQDYAEAYAWCKVAAFQKSNRGKRKLKCLEAKMNWNQIQRGSWLARNYYNLYVAHHNQ
jgi:TPR repeat protein